eukprot:1011012_1
MQKIHTFYMQKIHPFRSTLCDWCLILCLIIITATLEAPNRNPYYQCIPGYTHDGDNYPCGNKQDPELQYPYKPNSVDTSLLALLTFGPWIFTILINILFLYCSDRTYKCKIVFKKVEILLRMLLFSACGTEAVVSVIKFSVGRPRPNFFALIENDRSEEDHKQSRMSFPSGHASLSFSLLFLLTLNLFAAMNYVQIRFKKQNKHTVKISINNPHSYFYLKIWWLLRYYLLFSVIMVMIPTFVAVYIACTRITDYWHHYADVAVGALFGIAGASISFMIYRDMLYPYNVSTYKQQLIKSEDYEYDDENNNNIKVEYDIEHG